MSERSESAESDAIDAGGATHRAGGRVRCGRGECDPEHCPRRAALRLGSPAS